MVYTLADRTQMTRRKRIPVTGAGSGAQTDFQIRMAAIAYAVAMQNNFGDLRFTQADMQTLIDAWLEAKVDGSSADVWVEFPSTPANGVMQNYWMYYGNVGAASDWNGFKTFELFDDFDDDSTIAVNQTTKDTVYDTTRYAMASYVIKLHDGTLFAVFPESDQHGIPLGSSDLKWTKSTNNGSTWSTPQIITPHPDGSTDPKNPGVVEFDDAGTWTILAWYDLQTTTTSYIKCKKSTDGGATWGSEITITTGAIRWVYGTGAVLSNGDIIVPTYTNTATYAEISDDGGDTWSEYSIATTPGDSETSVIELSTNGHLRALMRCRGGTRTKIYTSTSSDYGRNWTSPVESGLTTTSDGAPATLLRLDDGDLLVSWEKTDADFRVARSSDEGATWDMGGSYSVYYDASMPENSGYVSSAQISATQVYSMFYIQYAAQHADLHGNDVVINGGTNTWNKVGAPTLDYSNSILRIHGDDNSSNRLTSVKSFSAPHIMESRSKIDWAGNNYGQIGFGYLTYPYTTNFAIFKDWSSVTDTSQLTNCDGSTENAEQGVSMNAYFVNKIKWKSDEVKFIYTGGTVTHSSNIPTGSLPIAIGGHDYLSYPYDLYLDWLFVRKYVANPPTASIGTEEHQRRTPMMM